jgi:hypothetical protein
MKILQFTLTSLTLSILAACGGGGGDSGGSAAALSGTISGTVTKGPVSNATVAAYAVVTGQRGAQLASAMTDSNGNFTLDMGSYGGPVMLQASGGSYTDEATGTNMTMGGGDAMTAAMPSIAVGAANAGVQVTPLTAMAQARASHMAGGMTDANIVAANAAMGSYFAVDDILHRQPMNPLVMGSGSGASQDARNYGMTLAAMSQYAKNVGMTLSSAMVTAMQDDASDGVMDGMQSSSPITMPTGGMMGPGMMAPTAGTSGLATAMTGFMNSTANHSGMSAADMTALIQKFANSNGHI